MREVASLPTIGNSSSTETVEVNRGHSNGATATSENSSLTSAGKGSEKSATAQGKGGENGGGEPGRLEMSREEFYHEVLAPLRRDGFSTATDEQLVRCRRFVEEEIDGARSLLDVASANNYDDGFGGLASASGQRRTANNMIAAWSKTLSAIEDEIRRRESGNVSGLQERDSLDAQESVSARWTAGVTMRLLPQR